MTKEISSFYRAVPLVLLLILICLSCNPKPDGNLTPTKQDNVLSELFSEIPSAKKLNSESIANLKGTRLASWNIRDLGRTKNSEEIYTIANTLRDFDIVAIQEVVAKDPAGAQAVAKIADELTRMGAKWDYKISDPTQSPSVYMSERYAFLWKTAKVSLANIPFLDKELQDICYREPYIAAFKAKTDSKPFYIVNFHSRKYYDKPELEIVHFINYEERLESRNIIIAGDFNLSETYNVWEPFYDRGFKSALKNEATTLKTKCKNGVYTNHAIDNFYFSSAIEMQKSGSIDFVKNCDDLQSARLISDHLPIFLEFKTH